MRKIFQYILMAVAMVATASCSNEMEETLQPANDGNLQFVVSDFPAFGESGQTRAAGISDDGKTAWTAGDQIFVTLIGSEKYGTQIATLSYDGSGWSLDKSLYYLEDEKLAVTVSALYAPCYEVADNALQLKTDMQLGMSEYIEAECDISDGVISISFYDNSRSYSRLRVVGAIEQTLTVITTEFEPAGTSGEDSYTYNITTDAKGNAYLYGNFYETATVSVNNKESTFEQTSYQGNSYALFVGTEVDLAEQTDTYVINDNGAYRFSGTGTHGIKVESGSPVIYLAADTKISVESGNALDITATNSTVTVGIESYTDKVNNSTFEATNGSGIFVTENSTVNITSGNLATNYSLTVIGGSGNPGIGGYINDENTAVACGNINVSNIWLHSYSKGSSSQEMFSAAIGGAGYGKFGIITMDNAVVCAYRGGENVDYIGTVGNGSEDTTSASSDINCGEGGSITNSYFYCYTGSDDTEADKIVAYDSSGNASFYQ